MYRVLFVDNEADIVRDIRTLFKRTFKIIGTEFKNSEEEMVDHLLSQDVDAYLIDYRFSDTLDHIQYTGLDLLNGIQKHKKNFPVIIVTSHEEDLITVADNPFNVVAKDFAENPEYFGRKLEKLIHSYKAKLNSKRARANILLKKRRQNNLTISEEEELIKIDSFLDHSISSEEAIPDGFKSVEVMKALKSLLSQVEDLKKSTVNPKEIGSKITKPKTKKVAKKAAKKK